MASNFTRHGALSWHELTSNDVEASMTFYSEVFGWRFRTIDIDEGPYQIIENQGQSIGGIMESPAPAMPSNWTGYITVSNVDTVIKAVERMGGCILFGPEDIPDIGRFCWIKDPQGAIIAAISYHKNAPNKIS